jgi:putative glutathione S-transferase
MFNKYSGNPELDLYPTELESKMKEVDNWIFDNINNGVYKCGFAKSQEAYDIAFKNLFLYLDKLELHLSEQRFVAGNRLTLSDIRAFVTLVRFDEVYVVYFKCDKKRIVEYPNLLNYCREIY